MAELVSLDCFEAANLYQVEAELETSAIQYTVQYQVKSREALERFGDRFQTTRRIYRSVKAAL